MKIMGAKHHTHNHFIFILMERTMQDNIVITATDHIVHELMLSYQNVNRYPEMSNSKLDSPTIFSLCSLITFISKGEYFDVI
ncbi:MAG: hypothetical protein AAGB24_10070 [Bacteroidota bacterium]